MELFTEMDKRVVVEGTVKFVFGQIKFEMLLISKWRCHIIR